MVNPVPFIPLCRVSRWLGLFFRRRRKVTSDKRQATRHRPLASPLLLLTCHLSLIAAVLFTGCSTESPGRPPIPSSSPGLPFPRTAFTERQRLLQERYKAEPNLPRRAGLVFRQSVNKVNEVNKVPTP
jgi:hypothetical protein